VALFVGEPVEVARVFDLSPALPGALVRGDGVVSVEDAHELVGGDEPQGLSYEGMRDRIVVAVEAQVRRLAGAQGLERVAVEGMGGQRQEAGPLVVQRDGDGALVRASGDETGMGDALDPVVQLGIEIVEGAECAGGEEGVAQVGMARSTRPFSFPRAGATGLGAKW
jgi:hypothetical protein